MDAWNLCCLQRTNQTNKSIQELFFAPHTSFVVSPSGATKENTKRSQLARSFANSVVNPIYDSPFPNGTVIMMVTVGA